MWTIYLKVTIEKKWRTENFDFLSLRSSPTGHFLRSSNSRKCHWILKHLVANLKSQVWEQDYVWLFYCFYFQRNYDVLRSENPCLLLNKNINFNKNETESKMENFTHTFREMNLVLQLVEESQIKCKTVMNWSSRNKRVHFL